MFRGTFIIQYPSLLWWPDKMWLDGLLKTTDVFNCPDPTRCPTPSGHSPKMTHHFAPIFGRFFIKSVLDLFRCAA